MFISPTKILLPSILVLWLGTANANPKGQKEVKSKNGEAPKDQEIKEGPSANVGQSESMEVDEPTEQQQPMAMAPEGPKLRKLTEPVEDESAKGPFASLPKFATLCANHELNFRMLYDDKKGEDKEVLGVVGTDPGEEEEEEMDAKNEQWLSTLLGKHLCHKLANQKAEEHSASATDYETEKHVWSAKEPEKEAQGFAVRAEKLFGQIGATFGVTDEELLESLSTLKPLKDRGGSGGVFFLTDNGKFIIKSLSEDHKEPAKMDAVLGNYVAHVLTEGKQSMMNTFFMCFRMNLYAKLKEKVEGKRKKVIRLRPLHLVVVNNAFLGVPYEKLLKFDIKGTFAPGSAVQHDQKQSWYTGNTSWEKSYYREYDFIGISRGGREIAAFFPEGIQLASGAYEKLANCVRSDAKYLSANGLNDYSLLLGVYFMDPEPEPPAKKRKEKQQEKQQEKQEEKQQEKQQEKQEEKQQEKQEEKQQEKQVEKQQEKKQEKKQQEKQVEKQQEKKQEKKQPTMEEEKAAAIKVDTTKCLPAICHNCKRRPDAKKYEAKLNLCLYMAIIDIITPSTPETEAHFLEIMQEKRSDKEEFKDYKSMADLSPYHTEIVTPVPPKPYGKRFVVTLLGCIFSPGLPTEAGAEHDQSRQFKLGMRQSICNSFGERRGYTDKANGMVVYGLSMFKEMMEQRSESAWQMLMSLSDSLLTPQSAAEFAFEKIDGQQFVEFGVNSDPRAPYFGLFSHGKEYYAMVRKLQKPGQKKPKKKTKATSGAVDEAMVQN